MFRQLTFLFWGFCVFLSSTAIATEIQNQIRGITAEHSRTKNNDEELYAAQFAVDEDIVTKSWTMPGRDGVAWFRLNLDQVYCVKEMVRYWKSGKIANIWRRTDQGWSCEGHTQSCDETEIVVSVESEDPGYVSTSHCVNGDRIELRTNAPFGVHHIVVGGELAALPELEFQESPSNVTTVIGETITFSCKFNRAPELSIQWLKDNEESTDKIRSGKWKQWKSGYLVVTNVNKDDSGVYTCQGRDQDRIVTSDARLLVNYFDVDGVRGPQSTEVYVGDSVTLSCDIPRSSPPARVSMYKEGEETKLSQNNLRYRVFEEDSVYNLIIENTTLSDTGNYYCISTNVFVYEGAQYWDPYISTSGELTVRGEEPGSLVVGNLEVVVNEGDSVVLELSVSADPAPQVMWNFTFREYLGGSFMSGVLVESTEKMEMSLKEDGDRYDISLKISDLRPFNHLSTFRATLSNRYGELVTPVMTMFVNHLECNTSAEERRELRLGEGEPVRLQCPVPESEYPAHSVLWIYNNSASSLRHSGHTLSTESSQVQDSGEYVCETWNIANTCRYVFNLEIEPREEVVEATEELPTIPPENIEMEQEMKTETEQEMEVGAEPTQENESREVGSQEEMEYGEEIDNETDLEGDENVEVQKEVQEEEVEDSKIEMENVEESEGDEGAYAEEDDEAESVPHEEQKSKEGKKTQKRKKCPTSHKKMSRKCLEEKWADRSCSDEKGATNTDTYTCGKWSKHCDKVGKNKSCCKAIYCWGKKLSEDFAGVENRDKTVKKEKNNCNSSHKKMNKKCLKKEWEERECSREVETASNGSTSCANSSKRCDNTGKNKSCCKAVLCWGKKLIADFPNLD